MRRRDKPAGRVVRIAFVLAALLLAGFAVLSPALAQDPNALPNFLPPPPPPPPPPAVYVPEVPRMDQPPRVKAPQARPSFGDRISRCLDAAAAAGLGPNERARYSRECAN